MPELRYESHLLGRLPANIMFFASIPNLAEYLGEAENVFRKKTAQSPELETWRESHGKRTAAVIEKLRAASEYLGDEIVVAALPESDGPVFLSEMKRHGFAEFLKQSGLPAAEEERNGLVVFGAPRAVEQLSGVLDSPNGGIQSTDFYRRIRRCLPPRRRLPRRRQRGAGRGALGPPAHPEAAGSSPPTPNPSFSTKRRSTAAWKPASQSPLTARAPASQDGSPVPLPWARSITSRPKLRPLRVRRS